MILVIVTTFAIAPKVYPFMSETCLLSLTEFIMAN